MRAFVKRNALWFGMLAVLVPLGVLLGLQYSWLVDLQKTSAIAETAYLKNYLEAVSTTVEYFYSKQAERALNIPSSYFAKGPQKIAHREHGSLSQRAGGQASLAGLSGSTSFTSRAPVSSFLSSSTPTQPRF